MTRRRRLPYIPRGVKKKKSYDVYGTLRINSSHYLSQTIQHLSMNLQEIRIKLQYNRLQIPHIEDPAHHKSWGKSRIQKKRDAGPIRG